MLNKQSLFIAGSVVIAGLIIFAAITIAPNKYNQPGTAGGLANVGGSLNDEGVVDVPIEGEVILGNENAPVTLVEYSDYQCPFCAKFFKDVETEIRRNYVDTGKVRLIYKDSAFLGPPSNRAAEAAACAQDQDKFWQFHDAIFSSHDGGHPEYPADQLKGFANDLGLDVAVFSECLDSEKYKAAVVEETNIAQTLGVNGTPTFFVNGKIMVGALPYSEFRRAIEAELSELGG